MCLFSVYAYENENCEFIQDRVSTIQTSKNEVCCTNLFGQTSYVKGTIRLVDTTQARVEIQTDKQTNDIAPGKKPTSP